MIKQLVIVLFFNCLISPFCLSQIREEVITISPTKVDNNKIEKTVKTSPKKKGKTRPEFKPDSTLIPVYFKSNQDFYLKIDKKEYKVSKGTAKMVKLNIGQHSLSFKAGEETENIDTSFNLTRNMGKSGAYAYPNIIFKEKIRKEPSKDTLLSANNDVKPAVETPVKKVSSETVAKDEKPHKILAIVNELSSNMVFIPGGSFTMGVKNGKVKELLPHTVTINSVKFGKYEVTQQQWETIMGVAYDNSSNKGCNKCPVDNVSWNAVDSFIGKLNAISKNKFRLPTEAEWEYVATKGIEKEIGTPASQKAFERKYKDFLEKSAWYSANSAEKTHPVGEKQLSILGVYDLLGNVAEWCFDYYRSDYQKDIVNNPGGPSTGKERLIKGGSYNDTEVGLLPPLRTKENPSTSKSTVGFRLVMDAN